jgi:MFS family permease
LRNKLSFLNGNILVFAVTDMLGNFVRGMVFSYSSLYILALGGDAKSIGITNFLGLLAGLFVLPIAGFVTDHADRIKLLVWSGFLSSLFLVWIAFASNWQAVAVASLLFGLIVIEFPCDLRPFYCWSGA